MRDGIAYRHDELLLRRHLRGRPQEVRGLVAVRMKSCSRHPAAGSVRVVQEVGSGSALTGGEYTVVDEDFTLDPGDRRTFGAMSWFVSGDSTVTVTFGGDVASWAGAGTYVINVDRRD